MKWRLWIVAGVNLALALWIALHRQSDSGPKIDVAISAIDRLSKIIVVQKNRQTVTLVKQQEAWVVSDTTVKPNAQAIELLTTTFKESIRIDQMIETTPDEYRRYGIGQHSTTVQIFGESGDVESLILGRVIDDQHTFIRIDGRDEIFRVNANLPRIFDRPALAWLDTRLFSEKPGNMKSISSFQKGKMQWSIQRQSKSDAWGSAGPIAFEVGQQEARAVANTLATAQASQYTQSATLQKNPTLQLKAETFEGRRLRLDVYEGPDGNAESQAFEKRSDQWTPISPICRIEKHQFVFLRPTINELRNRRVFDFDAQDVKLVSISGTPGLSLKRQSDDQWLLVGYEKRQMRRYQVDNLVEHLTQLRSAGHGALPDKEVFKNLTRTVTIQLKDGKIYVLEVGGPFGKAGRWVRVRNHPERAMILASSQLQFLSAKATELVKLKTDGLGEPNNQFNSLR